MVRSITRTTFPVPMMSGLQSFFGFDTSLDKKSLEHEDLAVYTWGEDSYDNLADDLDEKGDDLNDETFGSADPVG